MVDYLFCNILMAPMAPEEKPKKRKMNLARRASSAVHRASITAMNKIQSVVNQFSNARLSLCVPEKILEAHELATISSKRVLTKAAQTNAMRLSICAEKSFMLTGRKVLLNSADENDVNIKFDELTMNVLAQRRDLGSLYEKMNYDCQWGLVAVDIVNDLMIAMCFNLLLYVDRIDSSGNFYKPSVKSNILQKLLSICYMKQLCVQDLIKDELLFVNKSSQEHIEKLQFADDSHVGMEILHRFVLDLLGRNTPAAKIFVSKFQEE